ncbi:flavin reductase family protein [Candidatus Woesearchaeota archaeon]|nr:flavin reductase family protein [Candidatus Woesearchaeota archaeon]
MSRLTGPRQVILVTCRADAEIFGKKEVRDNIITMAWHMPVSFSPKLYAVSVGKTRFSCGLIRESKVFAVNFIPSKMKRKALLCGTKSGMYTDKFEAANIKKEECASIDCPRISGALAYMECRVTQEIDSGDHIIFIGHVIKSDVIGDDERLVQKDKELIGV